MYFDFVCTQRSIYTCICWQLYSNDRFPQNLSIVLGDSFVIRHLIKVSNSTHELFHDVDVSHPDFLFLDRDEKTYKYRSKVSLSNVFCLTQRL